LTRKCLRTSRAAALSEHLSTDPSLNHPPFLDPLVLLPPVPPPSVSGRQGLRGILVTAPPTLFSASASLNLSFWHLLAIPPLAPFAAPRAFSPCSGLPKVRRASSSVFLSRSFFPFPNASSRKLCHPPFPVRKHLAHLQDCAIHICLGPPSALSQIRSLQTTPGISVLSHFAFAALQFPF